MNHFLDTEFFSYNLSLSMNVLYPTRTTKPIAKIPKVSAAALNSIYLYPKKPNQEEKKKIAVLKITFETITNREYLLYQKGFFQGALPTNAKLRPIKIRLLISITSVEVLVSSLKEWESISGLGSKSAVLL
jgi:hypothetical protein